MSGFENDSRKPFPHITFETSASSHDTASLVGNPAPAGHSFLSFFGLWPAEPFTTVDSPQEMLDMLVYMLHSKEMCAASDATGWRCRSACPRHMGGFELKCHAAKDFFGKKRSASKSCSWTVETQKAQKENHPKATSLYLADFEAVFAGRPVTLEPHSFTFFSMS